MNPIPPPIQQRLDALTGNEGVRCRSWLASLPDNVELEIALPLTAGLSSQIDGLKADLDNIRSEITRLTRELRSTLNPPHPNFRAQAERWVRGYAARVTVDTSGGRFVPTFGTSDPLRLLCLLFPEKVADVLTQSAASDAASEAQASQQRNRAAAKLASEILAREIREEAIIGRLAERGVAIDRRPDASPEAILGVTPSRCAVPLVEQYVRGRQPSAVPAGGLAAVA